MQRKRAAQVRRSTGAHTQFKEACSGGCSSNFEGFIRVSACTIFFIFIFFNFFVLFFGLQPYNIQDSQPFVWHLLTTSFSSIIASYMPDSTSTAIWTVQLTGLVASTQNNTKRGSGKSAAPSPSAPSNQVAKGSSHQQQNARGWLGAHDR